MSVEQTVTARGDALIALMHCAWYRANRDDLIRHAHKLGVTYTEIARILGMNRGHVTDIGNAKPGGPLEASRAPRPAQHPKG